MIRPFAITLVALALTTAPALAQFPPPGIYQCVDMKGAAFGTLTLLVAGDYDFASSATIGGRGQMASSGNSVNALTGPLADIDLTGSFTTDERGEASFMFTTTLGSVLCALPAR
ncbi:hypothetical protein ASD04_15955 [Devosia sp. Root436]|jgi:hypothetical protein|uniref:hypothetical protein n=1 Tax=Devosia sp. Root436 TaxID=1736537 RepID=UPI0006F920E8|nr:hypothetical protein [Devosia sp. Root436]KQX34875.1 hypothetical protein ASD04_15955 [Devosia sp. Root436]